MGVFRGVRALLKDVIVVAAGQRTVERVRLRINVQHRLAAWVDPALRHNIAREWATGQRIVDGNDPAIEIERLGEVSCAFESGRDGDPLYALRFSHPPVLEGIEKE